MRAPLTYQCWDKSRSSCWSTNIACQLSPNIAHTHHPPNNMVQKHKHPPCWHFLKTFSWRNQGNSICCRQHIVLCPRRGHHCPHGIELNSHWTNKGNNKHNGKIEATFGLPRHKPWCNHTKLHLWHDHECAFGCILPVWIRCSQLRVRTFFHGLVCKRRQPHKIEWDLFYLMCRTAIHCRILHGSWT